MHVNVLVPGGDVAAGAAETVESDRSRDIERRGGSGSGAATAQLVVEPLVAPTSAAAIAHFFASGMRIRGREVAVLYDGTGMQERAYGFTGLAVWIDGVLVARAPRLRRFVIAL